MSIWCSFDVCGADEDGDGDGTVQTRLAQPTLGFGEAI